MASAAIRGVIFDMDGTLTRPYFDFDAIRREIGLPVGNATPILEALMLMTPEERARAEQILHAHENRAAVESELQDDALHVLERIRAGGLRVGLLTRNSRVCTEIVLTRHGLTFDCVHTREDGPVKPAPDAILRMCAGWGIAPGDVWMVGDYLFDVQAGRAAGTRTALIIGDSPMPDYADQADLVIRRLAELLPALGL